MYSFELSRYRRANVWLDEKPPAEFAASSTLARMVNRKNIVGVSRQIAAIELMVPHGPFPSYALLGGELIHSETDGLEVILPINSAGVSFAPSLAAQTDEARTGLPEEYADAVFAGIEKTAACVGVPANVSLRFRWAAHGLVGSSSAMFEKVAGLVVRLFALPRDVSEEQIGTLISAS